MVSKLIIITIYLIIYVGQHLYVKIKPSLPNVYMHLLNSSIAIPELHIAIV